MRLRSRLTFLALLALQVSLIWALAAANALPTTRLDNDRRAIGGNDLKPSACSAIAITNLRTGSGAFSGTGAADLMLGSSSVDSISGGNGSDCIVAGGGDDTLTGGGGTDACIGGPGTDIFVSCETQIQ